MSSRRIVALDCGASRVSAAFFSRKNGITYCESLTGEVLPSASGDEWPAAAAATIPKIVAAIPRGAPIVLVLPSSAILLKQLRIPRAAAAKSRQMLEFAVGQAWPHPEGELVWDGINCGDQGEQADHLVAAARPSLLIPLCQAIERAGLELVAILPSIFAVRAVEAGAARTPRRLLVEAGARAATFLQIDGKRFAMRAAGFAPAEGEDGASRLAQEATRTLLHFNRQSGLENPDQVVMVTEETWDARRLSRFGEVVKLPVEYLEPAGIVAAPEGGARGQQAAYARMLGAAIVALDRKGPVINLVPPAMRGQQQARRKRPWIIAAAVLAGTALLPPIFCLRGESATLLRQCIEKEEALAPRVARSRRIEAHQQEIATLGREMEKIEAISRHRTAWRELLAALQSRFATAEDAWLDRLNTVIPEGDGPMKLVLAGYLLDRGDRPVAERMKVLVRELRTIPAVAAVEGERFDASRPNLLRFELVLVVDATHPL